MAPIDFENNSLRIFKDLMNLSPIDNPTQIVRLSGECSELIFKAVCVRKFNESESSHEINEPLAYLNEDGRNFFYDSSLRKPVSPKLQRIQKL